MAEQPDASDGVAPVALAPTAEPILHPELPIIDAHHHLSATWSYGGPELLEDLHCGHNVVATVHIEVGASHHGAGGDDDEGPVSETQTVAMTAKAAACDPGNPRICAALVGAGDLAAGAAKLEPLLDAHLAAAGGRFRGLRCHSFITFTRSDFELMLRPGWEAVVESKAFQSSLGVLERKGLALDVLCTPVQFRHLAKLAATFEGVAFVVDHLGAPPVAGPGSGDLDNALADWRRALDVLAPFANVHLKLGGCLSPHFGSGFPSMRALHTRATLPTAAEISSAYRPMVTYAIERLGPSRCMFESNFPPDRAIATYSTLWNAFKDITKDYSEFERREMFAGSAATVYGIEL